MDELEKAGMQDTLSAMARSVDQVKENGYFRGMTVFVDAFNDFSFDELKMLDACIAQCKNITFSLCIDNESIRRYANHPFADTLKTLQQITDISADHNYKVNTVECRNSSFRVPELEYVSKEIYNTCKSHTSESAKMFLLYQQRIFTKKVNLSVERYGSLLEKRL